VDVDEGVVVRACDLKGSAVAPDLERVGEECGEEVLAFGDVPCSYYLVDLILILLR
jgi:hypothetical protein